MESVTEVPEEASGLRQPRFWIRVFLLLDRLPAKANEPCLHTFRHTHTHTHNVLRLFGFCPGQPRCASTRRNIHSLTPIMVIKYPYLLLPSTTIHGILPIQSMRFTVFVHNLSPSFLWSTSLPGTLHFILHTFFHPIIMFFSQHMPIPSQPVLL